jgi:hypothetical protein
MSKTRLDDGLSSLTIEIEELRQIRTAASVPYFAQSPFVHNNTSRLERIRLERKRLYGSGWLKLQPRSARKEEKQRQLSHGDDSFTSQQLVILDDENATGAIEKTYESFPEDFGDSESNDQTVALVDPSQKPSNTDISPDRLLFSPSRSESQKLQATVKLLSESPEEIGSLRAVLECSMNPELLDRLLNSSIFATHGSPRSGDDGVTAMAVATNTAATRTGQAGRPSNAPAETAQELKHRALLLEQSKLLDQVRTIYLTRLRTYMLCCSGVLHSPLHNYGAPDSNSCYL